MALRTLPVDLLYMTAELVVGKTIPLLVGIATLPLDQWLVGTTLVLGAVAGTLFSTWAARSVSGLGSPFYVYGNAALQLGFSVFASLSMLLSVSRGLTSAGVLMTLAPALCIVSQPLPQRTSTALVSVALNLGLFYACMITGLADSVWSEPDQGMRFPGVHHGAGRAILELAQGNGVISARDAGAGLASAWRRRAHHHNHNDSVAQSVSAVLAKVLQFFMLSFYACVQQAPLQVYIENPEDHRHGKAMYASLRLANDTRYFLFVGLLSAWVRICVWFGVCFFQDNAMHVILENSDVGRWDRFCCFVFMVALLFAAAWTWTQAMEQTLPWLLATWTRDSRGRKQGVGRRIEQRQRLVLLVSVLALAAFYRQRGPEVLFWSVNALSIATVASAVAALKFKK